jgi:hypothetical protein
MIITDADLKSLANKLSASRAENEQRLMTFSDAVAAAAKSADGVKMEALRKVRAMGRRLGVFLSDDKVIDLRDLNGQLKGATIEDRLAFKSMLANAGLLA